MFPIGLLCEFPMTDGTQLIQFFPNVAALWMVRRGYRRHRESEATAAID
jgi:hypothetical protein